MKLSVHKNTVERRRKRDLAHSAVTAVRGVIKDHDVRAYAFVAIDAKGKAHCYWDTGAILPMWAFAPTVAAALEDDLQRSGVDEDWVPALTVKGTTESAST